MEINNDIFIQGILDNKLFKLIIGNLIYKLIINLKFWINLKLEINFNLKCNLGPWIFPLISKIQTLIWFLYKKQQIKMKVKVLWIIIFS